MRAAAAVAALALVIGCGGPASPGAGQTVVRVAAASDLQPALEAMRPLLEAQGIELQATYGSSGTFLQQLGNGAPYDLYLSADAAYPEQVVELGLAGADDVFDYAVGRLVLWVPEGSSLDPADGLQILAREEVERVSIANPEHAPYGRAAVTAMTRDGVHDVVRPKLVLGENVAQAADFVVSGGADAGIVAKSLVLTKALRDVGEWAELDVPGLQQAGVVLDDRAEPVRDVLLGEGGRRVLRDAGFGLPER